MTANGWKGLAYSTPTTKNEDHPPRRRRRGGLAILASSTMVNLSVTAGASARIGRLAVAGAILALTFLTYYQFPGHTYLTSDSQIYVPILERYWDPTLFSHDPVAIFPHVSYTIYDEITLGIRKLSGADLRNILSCQQLVSRAAGIFGVYLLAE